VAFGLAVQLAVVVAALTASAAPGAGVADAAPAACGPGSQDRHYAVNAISLDIPVNRWGDRVLGGQMYVLAGDESAVRHWSDPLAADPAADPAGNRRLRPRPLVLRANEGECVEVLFTNRLADDAGEDLPAAPRASMHIQGAAYDVRTSDGAMVGWNDDTTVANRDDPATPGREDQIRYYWRVADEGLYIFRDMAVPAGTEHDAGTSGFGLFGGLAVEPAGSTWRDPATGKPLYTGTVDQSGELYIEADITPPSGRSFRESIQLSWDEIPGIGFGFNYGSEQGERRAAELCPDCIGEETSLSSWTYGDPAMVKLASGPGPWLPEHQRSDETDAEFAARVEDCGLAPTDLADGTTAPTPCYVTNVFHTYAGDPTKVRFGHAGSKETHVYHHHAHQWLADPKDVGDAGRHPTTPDPDHLPASQTLDSQTYGPGEAYTADMLFGAGSRNRTFGDSIFHCHLYPHFAEGFWGLMRVHDVHEDGHGTLPDGTRVRNLETLPGEAPLPAPGIDNPGYPRFVPGKFGWRAPQPPGGITEGGPDGAPAPRVVAGEAVATDAGGYTALERAVSRLHKGGEAPAGAPFADPCPAGAREVTYHVSVIQTDLVYNEAGWHDTQGRLYVLDEDVDDVLAGRKKPEPIFMRVNAGDCINYALTNRLPNWIGGDAFIQLQQTNMIGQHIHLVKFDVLASDGSSNGWNYQEAAFTSEQADFDRDVLAGTRQCSDDAAAGACRIPQRSDWDPSEGRSSARSSSSPPASTSVTR
jgi:hypothetical protein